MTFKVSKEFSIGLLVVATIAILFFGVNYLKGINLFNPTNYYYTRFADINGLEESSAITIRGYKVGFVKQIIYNYDDPKGDVIVKMQLDNDLKIPADSKAVLVTSMLGGANITLDLNKQAAGSFLTKGDTLQSVSPAGMLSSISDGIMPQVEQVIPHIDQLILNLNKLVSDPNLQASLANINKMTAELNATSTQLKKLVNNDIPPILADAKQITGNFTKVSDNLSGVNFQATIKKVDNTMDGLNTTVDKINNGGGTMSLLLNDRKLYDGLNSTVGDADKLLIDLKANPKRYVHFSVFAGKEKKTKNEEQQ